MGKIVKIGGLCLGVLLAAGCIRYHARPISLPRSLAEFASRSLAAPELAAFIKARQKVDAWPPPAWDFPTLTLVALYYHPDLDVARAQWAVAKAGRITAGERPNPTLSLLGGYNSTTPASEVSPWIPEAALEIPIETAGKRGYRIATARHLSEAARLNILATAFQVRSRLRGAMLDLYAAKEEETLLARQQEIQVASQKILEAQLEIGEASPYDVTSARIALANSRLAALAAGERRDRARVQLAAAVGLPTKAVDEAALSFADLLQVPEALPGPEIHRRALQSRADILGALSEYAASQSALQLEIAKQYPDINLGPNFQLDQTDNKWTLGLSLLLPILSRNKGPIAEAEARRSEAAARFLALQAKVISDIESAVAACQGAARKARAAAEMLAGLQKQEAAAEARQRLGEISRLELLGVQQELATSALSRLDALVKAQQALADLENAMQSPLDMASWLREAPARTKIKE